MNVRRIEKWAKLASDAIDKNWQRCDEETGEECKAIRCWMSEHRAMAYLDLILTEAKK